MSVRYIRALVLLYGLLNAAVYTGLLPLWEGFDEEFHYGYVQYLAVHGRFPVLGKTGLSEEINRSIDLLPMSFVMVENLHLKGVRTFDQYFALDPTERREFHDQAQRIPTSLRSQENTRYYGNYEVHHAPLAYMLMAIPDSVLSQIPLPRRVWLVRFLVAIGCVLLMFSGTFALGREAGLDEPHASLLLFLIFSCQMFWATIAHIGNDCLAVPLALWLVAFAMRCHREPTPRNAIWLSTIFALGLLSKAYFLVFVPLYLIASVVWYRRGTLPLRGLAALFAIPAVVAGPWYLRNLFVSGNLSGRIEESSGVTVGSALSSLGSIPWLKSLPFMARGAFWMGNGSFTDFSVRTMNAVLILLCIELVLAGRRRLRSDAFLWAPVLLFCAAMIYVTGSSYTYTKGLAIAASPWYLQAVMAPLLCLAMLGCQRYGRSGHWLARATAILWAYILAATYIAKLIPLYGGFTGGRSTLREIVHWYLADWPRTSDILNTTAMLPASCLLVLLGMLLVTLLCATWALWDSLQAVRMGKHP